jgi:hypothetical protein
MRAWIARGGRRAPRQAWSSCSCRAAPFMRPAPQPPHTHPPPRSIPPHPASHDRPSDRAPTGAGRGAVCACRREAAHLRRQDLHPARSDPFLQANAAPGPLSPADRMLPRAPLRPAARWRPPTSPTSAARPATQAQTPRRRSPRPASTRPVPAPARHWSAYGRWWDRPRWRLRAQRLWRWAHKRGSSTARRRPHPAAARGTRPGHDPEPGPAASPRQKRGVAATSSGRVRPREQRFPGPQDSDHGHGRCSRVGGGGRCGWVWA